MLLLSVSNFYCLALLLDSEYLNPDGSSRDGDIQTLHHRQVPPHDYCRDLFMPGQWDLNSYYDLIFANPEDQAVESAMVCRPSCPLRCFRRDTAVQKWPRIVQAVWQT